MSAADPVHIRLVDVKKRYGTHQVLHGVSFEALRGKTNVIIGASGSGKTVLMRQLIRLERPEEGQIIVDGVDIVPLGEVALNAVRKKFGMVFQASALFDSMTVFDNVAFPLREHTKFRGEALRDRVMDRLNVLGVGEAAGKMPAQLSGGMQKRVAVARALVLEPEILIYDEPTTGLDPITSRTVDDLMIEAKERFAVTSIVISHDMVSVFHVADTVHYLHRGKIVQSGTPEEVSMHPTASTETFLRASGLKLNELLRARSR